MRLYKVRKEIRTPLRKSSGSGLVLSIDPGVSGTGWAAWDDSTFETLSDPIGSGCILPTMKGASWEASAAAMARGVKELAPSGADAVIIEFPEFFESAGKGLAAARGGSLVKLAYLTGLIAGQFPESQILLVRVSQWKGSLPKSTCHSRVRSLIYSWSAGPTTHEMDAIGIGYFAKGFF